MSVLTVPIDRSVPTDRSVTARSRLVELPADATVEDLLHGRPRKLVFTSREQRRCSQRRDLTGWGGRLAAKLAACDVLGITGVEAALAAGDDPGLTGLEVLPAREGLCPDPARCLLPHRPELTLGPAFARHLRDGERLDVSISHTRSVAIALVVRFGPDGCPSDTDIEVRTT